MNTFERTEKNPVHFTFNHLNKTIVGTELNFQRSGNPGSPLYKELMDRMAAQPTYTFEVIYPKKKTVKKTYKGLTHNMMIDYLNALADIEEDGNKAVAYRDFGVSLEKMKTDKVPFAQRKQLFLEKFEDFDVNKAEKVIKDNDIHLMKVKYKIIRLGKPEASSGAISYNKAINE